ncbi:glycosyltransferase family 2 protein [Pseudomonas sp. CFBP 13727]|uniref:glycosyltransferase family 2 protein n=1 Tax=Pseudomonas sp. CFBP 13727 TaxID=2775295 RepID=UPI0017858AAF|nr:glycosyltransferase family 2 protein [Pseudomonas sp. CFBP 13727]MBD8621586.1 glycosyltransferase family 2 protein [Pseudomonas sp. CFBP 13727]
MDIFHRHRQANEHDLAAVALERAMQTSEYRPEALIWKGIDALSHDPQLAFIFLSNAAHLLPHRPDVHALVGRCILLQNQPETAKKYLSAAWQKNPNDASLRMTLWQARSQSESSQDLRASILAHLPDINEAAELSFVLKLLLAQPDTASTVGVVRFNPADREIQGWAVDLRDPQTAPTLHLEANGQAMSVTANLAHPLLTAVGLPSTHGGIRIKVPNPTPAVQVRFGTGAALLGSPVSAMPTFVPPPALEGAGATQPVDVLIPVYDGLEETLDCINSAIAARKLNRTPHRIVVLDDATPVPALHKALKILASKGKIKLIQNPMNLGFIRNMNRGMALSGLQDVVWLNADTRVHGNWLDRLRDKAYTAADIASVTPFTNNGELMSFPVSRISAPMPTASEHAELDELARTVNSPAVELETGCGFCLYIKRSALDAVGYLDEVHLSRGYGEETDWCLRARQHGFRHLGAPNVFVAHKGGVSFKEEKQLRVAYNNAILRKRFPTAEADYDAFCKRDPLRPARNALQSARFGSLCNWLKSEAIICGSAVALHVQPDSPQNFALSLVYRQGDTGIVATLSAPMKPLALVIDYSLPKDGKVLFGHLTSLIKNGVANYIYAGGPVLPADLEHTFDAVGLTASVGAANSNPTHRPSIVEKPAQRMLIADDLSQPATLERWIQVARQFRRAASSTIFCVEGDTPALKTLLATGAVQGLTPSPGFERATWVTLSGCKVLATLDTGLLPDAYCIRMAALHDIPLHSMRANAISESTSCAPAQLDRSRTEASSLTEL